MKYCPNVRLIDIITTSKCKIQNVHNSIQYEVGLRLLAAVTCDKFLDIPHINMDHRFDIPGLFYNIPYFDDDLLYTNGHSLMLIVIYKIEHYNSIKSLSCPLRIDIKWNISMERCDLIVYLQDGDRPKNILLFGYDGNDINKYSTEIPEYNKIKLSELLNYVK